MACLAIKTLPKLTVDIFRLSTLAARCYASGCPQ